MSNAAKHRKRAAEFEQLKQVDRAIASYVKAIEESEAAGEDIDVALFNKVGDLALRQGRVSDAITYYERAVEHYTTSGLFNNAIALCNKILRSAPGRANVYFTLGRICGRKGLRGDATRNFLEYATRMQQEGRVEEGMRALAEVADLMPELTEVQALVEDHAARAGIALPRRRTPIRAAEAVVESPDGQAQRPPMRDERSHDLIFLDVDYGDPRLRTPRGTRRVPTPRGASSVQPAVASSPAGNDAHQAHAQASTQALPFLEVPGPLEGLLDIPDELGGAVDDLRDMNVAPEPSVIRPGDIDLPGVPALDGLEITPGVSEPDAELLEGYTPDAVAEDVAIPAVVIPPPDVTWLMPPDTEAAVRPLEDVLVEDIRDPLGEHGVQTVILTETPLGGTTTSQTSSPTPVSSAINNDGMAVIDHQPEEDPESIGGESIELEFLDFEPFDDGVLELEAFDVPFPGSNALGTPRGAMESIEGLDALSFEFDASELDLVGQSAPIEPLDITSVPELDAAIAAGAELVAQAEAAAVGTAHDPDVVRHTPGDAGIGANDQQDVGDRWPLDRTGSQSVIPRPAFRIDPHDFVQSGELPPMLLSDAQVDRGLQVALETPTVGLARIAATPPVASTAVLPSPAFPTAELLDLDDPQDATGVVGGAVFVTPLAAPVGGREGRPGTSASDATLLDLGEVELGEVQTRPPVDAAADGALAALREASPGHREPAADAAIDAAVGSGNAPDLGTIASDPRAIEVVHPTPSLPTAAVAVEAVGVATSRRDALRAAVARMPLHWLLRRRLAESLFEAGERDAALHELETAQQGLANDGEYQTAAEIADELVQVSPDHVPYHQKRVELAVRLQAQDRLQFTYLDLADALVRMGEEGRARAVYARVLELDPYDDRARAALGAAAPPPPPPPRPDDQFVDLADWLRDDDRPASTRMRMREPVISGDEQADFNSLLQHFKDGVARSLGENDFEGHYDLGVAYKEMGLLDDAITEFQKALRSRTHRLPAYEALGQCFVEQGRHQIAATVLSRALHEPGIDDDQRVGVLYLLAYSCEALQRTDEARSYFQRVYATDINFRDVAARLAALDQATR